MEAMNLLGITKPLLSLGLPDAFIEHGDYNLLMAQCGLDASGIEAAILARFPDLGTASLNLKTPTDQVPVGK